MPHHNQHITLSATAQAIQITYNDTPPPIITAYASHKAESLRIASMMPRDIAMRGANAYMADCGSMLMVRAYLDGHRALHRANFCRARLCPMCQWRTAVTRYASVMRARPTEIYRYGAIHVILTVPSVSSDDLDATVSAILRGSNTLYRRLTRTSRPIITGQIRNLEITRNHQTGLWHPHIHMLWAVSDGYGHDNYMTQDTLAQIWADIMHLPTAWVWMRGIKPEQIKNGKHIAELTKYCSKSIDIHSPDDIRTLYKATYNRRLWTTSGTIRRAIGQAHVDADDNDIGVEGIDYIIEWWHWVGQQYIRGGPHND